MKKFVKIRPRRNEGGGWFGVRHDGGTSEFSTGVQLLPHTGLGETKGRCGITSAHQQRAGVVSTELSRSHSLLSGRLDWGEKKELPRGRGDVCSKEKHTYSQCRAKGTLDLPLRAEQTLFVGLADAMGATLRSERGCPRQSSPETRETTDVPAPSSPATILSTPKHV